MRLDNTPNIREDALCSNAKGNRLPMYVGCASFNHRPLIILGDKDALASNDRETIR